MAASTSEKHDNDMRELGRAATNTCGDEKGNHLMLDWGHCALIERGLLTLNRVTVP